MLKLTLEDGPQQRFQSVNEAVSFLETREGLTRGELEWVRVQLRYELSMDVLPPITREEYRLELDTDWLEAE